MNKQTILSVLAGFIIVVICLLPVAKSGLYSDDLPNFQKKSLRVESNNSSIYNKAAPAIANWKLIGRYTPFSFIWMELIYDIFTTVESYKLFMFLMNIIAVLLFLIYLKSIGSGINTAIWLICFGAVVQFHINYHDAYTSLNGLYQVLAVFIFTTLILFNYYLQFQKIGFLILAAAAFIMALFTSELALITLMLFPFSFMLLKIPIRKFRLGFFVMAFVGLAYLGYTLWLRSNAPKELVYAGIKSNFHLSAMFWLFLKHLYATLPLSNFQNKSAIPIVLFHQLSNWKNLTGILILIAASIYIFKGYTDKGNPEKKLNFQKLLFSVSLMVFPAMFIMPSVKYQTEVQWGVGYLPVYLQNFGTATLLAFCLEGLMNSKGAYSIAYSKILLSFILFCASVTFLVNNSFINTRSYRLSFPAQVFYERIKSGLLDNVPGGSTLVLGNDFYYQFPLGYQELFMAITGKTFQVYDAGTDFKPLGSEQCFYLDCNYGRVVNVSLYEMDCNTKEKTKLLQSFDTICDIDVIKEDGI